MTAEPADYEQYRRTRVAPTLEQRLTASFRYLRERSDGRWRAQVAAWFKHAEASYYAGATNSIARLEAYLAALPNGPHASSAAERLVELRLAEEYRRRRERRLLDEAREVEAKLGDAARMRGEFLSAFKSWVARLAAVRNFGVRTHELDHELIYEFRLREPAGRCATDLCTKALSFPYAIPEARRQAPRRAFLDVLLVLDDGAVVAARLAGPELWSRIGEALALGPVPPSAIQARTEAIARVVQVVSGAVEPVLPAVRCAVEAVSPVVLARECDGVRLEVLAAPSAEHDDYLEVRPVRGSAKP
jgi:hypothetical protein